MQNANVVQHAVRYLIAVVPLASTPILVWALAEGHINLGGGEKDILMAIPWMIWSLFFGVAYVVALRKGHAVVKAAARGVGWAVGLVVLLWLFLWLVASSWLGI